MAAEMPVLSCVGMKCERQEELRREATAILDRIDALNREQVEAIKNWKDDRLLDLDKELEAAFGEKERAFGALLSHRDEHGC